MIFIRNDNMNLGKDMSIEQTNSKTYLQRNFNPPLLHIALT